MSDRPLVSCVMPTSGRPQFAQAALGMFLSQTYGPRELVILDNSLSPSFADPPLNDGVRYAAEPDPPSLGAKRNAANAMARGKIICHWDDDDLSHPLRLEDQVGRLLRGPEEITGYEHMLFLHLDSSTWRYRNTTPGYVLGTSLMYWRRVWEKRPFPEVEIVAGERKLVKFGEDTRWICGMTASAADAGWFLIARNHGGNVCDRSVEKMKQHPGEWSPCPPVITASA
jgi:glycosyltransferase involved in cell wall biosynthesis